MYHRSILGNITGGRFPFGNWLEMKEPRNLYFDFLRGIAIMMVVGIHTFLYADVGFGSFRGSCNVVIRQLFNCAVPLFLAISGFFLAGKDLSDVDKRYAFWKHQIPKVYLPTLIWGVPWLILSIAGGASFVKSVFLWLFCGFSVFYYIALIIQYYLLLPAIQRFSFFNPLRCCLISAMISLVSIVVVTWFRAYRGVNLPMLIYAGSFPVQLLFFVLGVALSRIKRDYCLWWVIIAFLAGLFLQYLETSYLVNMGVAGYGIKLSSFIYSTFVILLLFSKRIENMFNSDHLLSRLIAKIGTLSLGMYLSHMLVYRVLKHLWVIDGWLVRWLVVFAIDILLVLALNRVLPKKVSRLLGV